MKEVTSQLEQALVVLIKEAQPEPGDIMVIGCSTSEVVGHKIGTASNEDVANAIYKPIADICRQYQLNAAFQCCEHLNRALVVEKETAKDNKLIIVRAVPKSGAGGALAGTAYKQFNDPVLVEQIQGRLGIDIGDTFIGMHLQPVLKPVRASIKRVGDANLTMGFSRPKLIGGERATYC